MDGARDTAERVARASYGRLLAMLAARSRDIAAAEDALADAFRAALETWPVRGIPDRPDAWLLTAARRGMGHARRHTAVRDAASAAIAQLHDERAGHEAASLPDHRLSLLFVCAHPAIDAAMRTPLMLQTVLGLDAARIAAAFLVPPATMGQRLVRAKAKIRDAGIPFHEPDPRELPARLDCVLAAIYAAFGTGWDAHGAQDGNGLAQEAIYLGRLLAALLPDQPEARGLLALMLYCQAREGARRTREGDFVPLESQDPARWSRPSIIEAEEHLTLAARARIFGRYQTEAAIQSVHVQRAITGRTETGPLVALYDLLATQTAAIGVEIARAAVHGEAFGPAAGLALLRAIDPARVEAYQPYWATLAHLLRRAGENPAQARSRAIELTSDPAIRAHLAASG